MITLVDDSGWSAGRFKFTYFLVLSSSRTVFQSLAGRFVPTYRAGRLRIEPSLCPQTPWERQARLSFDRPKRRIVPVGKRTPQRKTGDENGKTKNSIKAVEKASGKRFSATKPSAAAGQKRSNNRCDRFHGLPRLRDPLCLLLALRTVSCLKHSAKTVRARVRPTSLRPPPPSRALSLPMDSHRAGALIPSQSELRGVRYIHNTRGRIRQVLLYQHQAGRVG